MKPRRPVPGSIRFSGRVSASSRVAAMRFSTATRRTRALPGSITSLAGTFSMAGSATVTRVPRSTTPLTWAMRVVMRRITGVSSCSLNS